MERKYVAFISYRHAKLDSAVAKQLHTLIEQYRIPRSMRSGKKRFGTVFRDQEELPVSSNLSDDICRALDNAQYLIVVCSTNTAQSPWVTREIEYFLSHHDRQQVFTVLASGEPVDVFPKQLTQVVNADGSITDVEPLAVDVRADTLQGMVKKMRREIYRLYAAFLGCPYDALVHREQRRQRRRLAAVMSAVFAVVLSFMGLMLAKNYEIDQKNQALEGMNQELEDINSQLEEKNDALAEQKAQVQLRESELLAEEALELLEQGNTLAAVRSAVQALPKPGDDRPYYAMAEKVLIEAMDVFAPDPLAYSVTETVLSQRTPVKDFSVSEDGSRLTTIDEYNVVNCYDTVTAEKLWTYQISTAVYGTNMKLHAYPQANAVIACGGTKIAAFSYETGIPLWIHDAKNSMVAYVCLQNNTLAYLGTDYETYDTENSQDKSIFQYVFLNMETCEVKNIVQVAEGPWLSSDESLPHVVFPDQASYTGRNGAFSHDGSLFAGSYFMETSNNTYNLCYFAIDVASGEIVIRHEENVGQYYSSHAAVRMGFTNDDSGLLVIRRHPESRRAGMVDLWDIHSNKLLWQTELPEEEGAYFSGDENVIGLLNDARLYLSCGNYLYVVELSSGQVPNKLSFDTAVSEMSWVNGFMGIVLADGRYTVGWRNSSGVFFSDIIHDDYINLGENTGAKLWNNGLAELKVDGTQVQGLDLEDYQKERGFVALIPAGNANSVKIKRYSYMGKTIDPQTVIELSEEDYLSSGDTRKINEDVFLFGPVSDWSAAETGYKIEIINAETGEASQLLFDEYVQLDDIMLLSDGSGYLSNVQNWHDDLLLVDMKTGKQTAVFENPALEFVLAENVILTESEYMHDSVRLADTNQILSVRLGHGELTWWLDGKEEKTVTIPEDITAELFFDYYAYRMVIPLENGTVLLKDYDQSSDEILEELVLYDIEKDSWHRLPDANMMVANQRTNHVGLLTQEEEFILYDYVQGQQLHRFYTQLPQNSVNDVILFLNETYLAVRTKDDQFLVYEVATGEIVYSDQFGGYSDSFQLFLDTKQERLYVTDEKGPDSGGFYIHIPSWTKLADIPGLMYYDAQRNEVFCFVDNGLEGGDKIVCYAMPSTEELVEMGQRYIGE